MAHIPIPDSKLGKVGLTSIPPLLERAKLAFVVALRAAFQSPITDENLRYQTDRNKTKLRIYTAYPLELEFFPVIVVSSTGGNGSIQYMQDDFVEETDNKLIFAGRLEFTISLTILSMSTLERERILDHLIIYIRHVFRSGLRRFGLEMTKDIRIGAERITEIENKPVYEQDMEIPCYLEYEAPVDQSALETIQNITIDDIKAAAVEVLE